MAHDRVQVDEFLPLPLATFHILLALADDDRHGYGIIQDVAARTDGQLKLSAGTLYRSIQRMLEDPLADFILGRELAPGSTLVVDRREDPAEGEAPVEIRVIEGTPVPAAVGGPADEDDVLADLADLVDEPSDN